MPAEKVVAACTSMRTCLLLYASLAESSSHFTLSIVSTGIFPSLACGQNVESRAYSMLCWPVSDLLSVDRLYGDTLPCAGGRLQ